MIASSSNPTIKQINRLREKSRARRQDQLFVMEDWKEIRMAIENGYLINQLVMREGALLPKDWLPSSIPISIVKNELLTNLVYR